MNYDHRQFEIDGPAYDPPPATRFVRRQRERVARAFRALQRSHLNEVEYSLIALDALTCIRRRERPAHRDYLRGRVFDFYRTDLIALTAFNGSILVQADADFHEATWGPLTRVQSNVLQFLRDSGRTDLIREWDFTWDDSLTSMLEIADLRNSVHGRSLLRVQAFASIFRRTVPDAVLVLGWVISLLATFFAGYKLG